jgi:hypothetical protein
MIARRYPIEVADLSLSPPICLASCLLLRLNIPLTLRPFNKLLSGFLILKLTCWASTLPQLANTETDQPNGRQDSA